MHLHINDRLVSAERLCFCRKPSKRHWPNCSHQYSPTRLSFVLRSAVQNHPDSLRHTSGVKKLKHTAQNSSDSCMFDDCTQAWSKKLESSHSAKHLSFAREIATEQRSLADAFSSPCQDAFSKSRNTAESWALNGSDGAAWAVIFESRNCQGRSKVHF